MAMDVFTTSAVAGEKQGAPLGPGGDSETISETESATAGVRQRLASRRPRWDAVLVSLVFLSAFFLASFPVRNSAFWLHLGTGQALMSGQGSIGAEPFTQQPGEDF